MNRKLQDKLERQARLTHTIALWRADVARARRQAAEREARIEKIVGKVSA
jgi:hypothetical protein